jgi:hypothetical protein
VKLLILDDWGLEPLTAEQRHDMLEIVEDRYGRGATFAPPIDQLPVDGARHQAAGGARHAHVGVENCPARGSASGTPVHKLTQEHPKSCTPAVVGHRWKA